jgi:hypothetical protein
MQTGEAHEADTLRRRLAVGVVPVVWLTALLVVALAAGWPERSIAVRIWLVGVGLVALRTLVLLLDRRPVAGRRDAFERAAATRSPGELPLPPSVVASQRLVELVAGTAGDVHFRVRPVLREVAAHRLLISHGLDLDDPPSAGVVAERCGPLLWGLVRPDRPEPADRRRHELDARAATELVSRLEAL